MNQNLLKREKITMIMYNLPNEIKLVCPYNLTTSAAECLLTNDTMYSRVNSINSPSSGAGNVNDPRLISQIGSEREFVCANSCAHR